MKRKRLSILVLLVLCMIALVGCGGSATPEGLWNKYVRAMNSKSLEKVAEVYYVKDTANYNNFIESHTVEEYFPFDEIETTKFETDISSSGYFSAFISINVNDSAGQSAKDFYVYFMRDIDQSWKFISEVNVTTYDITEMGNKPSKEYYTAIVKTGEGFDYKYIYAGEPGEVSDNDYIKIVAPLKNASKIEIPETIEGRPVQIIGDYAFFDYTRIFSLTFPRSRLEEIILPDTIKSIEQYAFYQAKNLKSIVLPKSLVTVKNYAFASCTNLETMVINVDESNMYGEGKLLNIVSHDSMDIDGLREIYVEDNVPNYKTFGGVAVEWSVDKPEIATINAAGKLTALSAGTVTVKAVNKANSSQTSEAQVTVLPKADKIITSTGNLPQMNFTINRTIYVGDTASLKNSLASLWSTSDPAVATVDDSGKFTAVGPGSVTITATSKANSSYKASATVTVKSLSEKTVTSTLSYEPIKFSGARNLFVSDYINLQLEKKQNGEDYELGEIIWTSTAPQYASVSLYEGEVIGLSQGMTQIVATLKDNPTVYSVVNIEVKAANTLLTFSENSLDRLNNLKELYINAINPYSVDIKGTLKLPEDTIIYVPAQNYITYLSVWSDYKNQIKPIE